ncbi:MAG: prolipoprotein diacylglyceryl transferase [Planctomycetota bacterium]
MCRELLRIPAEWGGVPILGVGVALLVWLLGAAVLIGVHAKRRGVDDDFWAYLWPVGVGALVILLAPRFAPQGVPIRGYGAMLLLAIVSGVTLALRRAERIGVDGDTILSLVFWLFVAGISGARAFFVIEYWEVRYAGLPPAEMVRQVLMFTEGGLVVYGSLIGATIAFVVFVRRHGLPMLGMADVLAPGLLVGLAIGRIGCLLNGCCYGGPCERPWALTFPPDSPPYVDQLTHGELHGVRLVEDGAALRLVSTPGAPIVDSIGGYPIASIEQAAPLLAQSHATGRPVTIRLRGGDAVTAEPLGRTRSLPVHPTQLYSAINAALVAWLLWEWFPLRRRDGEVALAMLSIYPVSRFLLEVIRTDERSFLGTGLSISQNVSLGLLAAAAIGWVLLLRTPPGTRLAPAAGGERTAPPAAA